jgi:hypothetical protein
MAIGAKPPNHPEYGLGNALQFQISEHVAIAPPALCMEDRISSGLCCIMTVARLLQISVHPVGLFALLL